MRYPFLFAALLLAMPLAAQSQPTLLIHTGSGDCTYTTSSAIKSNATPGQLETTAALTSGNCGNQSNPSVEFGPASPLAPSATTLPGTSGSVGYTFQPLNATQCTALFTGGNGSSTATFTGGNPLCSGSACNNPVTATANFVNNSTTVDANYSVNVTCTGLGAQAVSTATVVVPHTVQTGSCPALGGTGTITQFTQQTGNQTVRYYGGGAGTGLQTVNVGSFDSVWFAPWPGEYGRQAQFTLPTNKYLSMAFSPPANYFAHAPSTLYGNYTVGSSGYQAAISMTISTACGDFSNPTQTGSTVVPGCFKNMLTADSFIQWRKYSPSNACVLQDNTAYFLNIINANISNVTPGGGTAATTSGPTSCVGSCNDPVNNLLGNWNTYSP